jgi:hypothetical protein
MKTLELAAMLILTFGWAVAAICPAATPASATGAKVAHAAATSPAPGDPGPSAESPGRRVTVSVHIDVAWDPKQLPLTDDDLKAFAERSSIEAMSGFAGKPATFERIALPKPPATTSAPAWPTIKADWQAARFTASGDAFIAPGFEKELEYRRHFRSVRPRLIELTEAWMEHLQLEASDTYRQLDEEIKKLDTRHFDVAARAQVKKEAKARLRAMELDLIAKEARRGAIEKAIHSITERAASKAAEDPILRELEKIRDLREGEVKKVKQQFAAGVATASDSAQTEISLLEATVKVAQRKEAVASAVSGDLLPKLASEQAMIGIDIEEMRMRMNGLDGDLAQLERPALEAVQKLETAKKRLAAERCWVILASPEPTLKERKDK